MSCSVCTSVVWAPVWVACARESLQRHALAGLVSVGCTQDVRLVWIEVSGSSRSAVHIERSQQPPFRRSEHSYSYLEVQPEFEVGSCQPCLCMHLVSALITADLDTMHRSVGTTLAIHPRIMTNQSKDYSPHIPPTSEIPCIHKQTLQLGNLALGP